MNIDVDGSVYSKPTEGRLRVRWRDRIVLEILRITKGGSYKGRCKWWRLVHGGKKGVEA